MTPERNDKKLTRWLLVATIALLLLVLGLQLWQIFGRNPSDNSGSLSPDSVNGPAAPEVSEPSASPAISPGKAAMIEDVRALNGNLSAGDLAKLSAQELEQLYETGAPGLPIGLSSAAQAAEEYAGTLAADSVTSETDPELDESPAHYEVELHHPTLGDFEYKIDAYTGQVLEGAPDILRSVQAADAPQSIPEADGGQAPASGTQTPAAKAQTPAAQAPASGVQKPVSGTPAQQLPADSGEEAAKQAAFTHAGVSAADAASVRCKLDWEDGRQVYDIEFWVGSTEYDYEIDASTNAVLKAEQDRNEHPAGTSSQPSDGFIGEEAAKSAALTHAGVSAADAGYIKCELDEDDGRWIYEIEFRAGGAEYDYEISAADGAVLKAEQDR